MTTHQIRCQFIEFFKSKGHLQLPESSLLPQNDPSVLLTTAGMQQFKEWFIKPELAKSRRVITIQPSFRTSDIEQVGDDTHLTLFEMLGNFSFGDYYKIETVAWWLEFLELLGIKSDRIIGTVFGGDPPIPPDDGSMTALNQAGLDQSKIKLGSKEDNFWGPTGQEGPCGPSIELYVDGVEIGTLVFNEYYSFPDHHQQPLTRKGVDVGIGLERLAVLVQKVGNVYQTDEFRPIMALVPKGDERSRYIVADHIRGITFLIADGVVPSNVKQGYILRRLIRRLLTHLHLLAAPWSLVEDLANATADTLSLAYPKLNQARQPVLTVIKAEGTKFSTLLTRAQTELQKIIAQTEGKVLSGQAVWDLQATHGLPVEITRELSAKNGYLIAESDFKKALADHQTVSRGT